MEILIGLALLGILWLISPYRWQKSLRPFMIALFTGLVLFSPIGLQLGFWGLTAFVPLDAGDTTDAIVVLGRGPTLRASRVVELQELWQAKRAPRIFASGMMDARAIVQSLKELGMPAKVLSGEECSQSTEENALFTSAILRPEQVQKILLVTDSPHMLRSLLLFRSFGFQVVSHPIALSSQTAFHQQWLILIREFLALVISSLKGQFKPLSIESLDHPPQEVTQKMQDWQCWVQSAANP
jgi:uncharacterized SAM-binding protein YcdF (DUF218 family)